jgi:hypothetical protein
VVVRKHLVILFCLWTVVTTGYFFWRASSLLVWCDSPQIAKNLFDESRPLFWSDSDKFYSIFHYSFYDVSAEGYRPLSRAIAIAGTLFFSDPKTNPHMWIAAVGALIGFLAVVSFLVSRRFLNSDPAALFAVFLFLFSAPVITGAWNVFCGIQAIVPLFVCLSLLLYWRANEASRYNGWYWAGLYVVLFLGPWFREFIGLLPVLVVILEIQRARRPTILMAIAGLFFLHSLYPAAIMKFTIYPGVPLKPVFAMGHLGVQTGTTRGEAVTLLATIWSGIRWEMPLHFLSLYPSLLLLLVQIALLLPAFRLATFFKIARIGGDSAGIRNMYRARPLPRHLLLSLLFVVGAIALLAVNWRYGIGFWLCSGLVFLALRRDAFLASWFLLFFTPFLWVFTEQVHLAYPLLPASIIVVTGIEDLDKAILAAPLRATRWAFMAVLAIALGDHSLNPYSSYIVVHSVNSGILQTARWFRSHIPQGSIVICNALHAEDIRLFSHNHFTSLWTVRAGIPRDNAAVTDPEQLAAVLRGVQGRKEVYFLDLDFNYTPAKVRYHAHKYVRNESVAMRNVGVIHTTRALYPYLDPLKALVSRPYISFLGPPDLENDFYRGPAQNGSLFVREVYANYHVYRVTGTEVAPWEPNSTWNFVEKSYKGFNIFENRNRYIAFAQFLGPVDLHWLNSHVVNEFQARHGLAIGNSVEDVKRLIDELVEKVQRSTKTLNKF